MHAGSSQTCGVSISFAVAGFSPVPFSTAARKRPYSGAVVLRLAAAFGFVGYYLAAELPPLLAGALLFLTPMSFLMSTARNAKAMMDQLALVLGLVLGIFLTAADVQLDLLWTGIGGGTLAYFAHRLREATA